jgi:hypothetical protein
MAVHHACPDHVSWPIQNSWSEVRGRRWDPHLRSASVSVHRHVFPPLVGSDNICPAMMYMHTCATLGRDAMSSVVVVL